MKKTKVYLATPYGHDDMRVCIERFERVSLMAFKVMRMGYHVISPISHSHPIALLAESTHLDHEFWLDQDTALLEFCDELWVYCQPGWEDSYGVHWEIAWAKKNNKPIKYINFDTEEII